MGKEARHRLGCLVKTHRKAKGLKQAELAEAVGVSPEHISHIECGTSSASLNCSFEFRRHLALAYILSLSMTHLTVSMKI